MYLFLKYVHLAFAVMTISGFVLRGFWMLTESDRLSQRATRIAPHVIDALFLLTGIALFIAPWINNEC